MYKQIAANVRYTWGLVLVFLIFIIGLGFIFTKAYNNPSFLIIAVIVSLAQTLVSYYYSDSITLAMSGARLTNRQENLQLVRIVENLSITSGLPMPKVYVINDGQPNAFATGRDPKHASIAVTTGLLEKLDKTELEGVISHEMSHVKNYDIRLMTIVVVLVGAVALASDWFLRLGFWSSRDRDNNGNQITFIIGIVLAIIAPISAMLVQLAISRKREYLADASGALLTRYPEGLASALEKISADGTQTRLQNRAMAHLFIASPFREDSAMKAKSNGTAMSIFSTHPPIADRVKKLREMTV